MNHTILVLSAWIPIIWNTNYIIHRLSIPLSIEAKINHSIQNIFQSLFLPKFFSNSIFCAIIIDKISGCKLHLTLVNYNCSYWSVKFINHMLRLFYYIIYSSNVTLEYLTQILSMLWDALDMDNFYFLFLLFSDFIGILFFFSFLFRDDEEACDIEVTWHVTWCDVISLGHSRKI